MIVFNFHRRIFVNATALEHAHTYILFLFRHFDSVLAQMQLMFTFSFFALFQHSLFRVRFLFVLLCTHSCMRLFSRARYAQMICFYYYFLPHRFESCAVCLLNSTARILLSFFPFFCIHFQYV